jgi:quercetin dioxygenase-like cupin family protein
MKQLFIFGTVLTLVTTALASCQNDPAAGNKTAAVATQWSGIRRTDLQQHDLSAPGREVIQARVDIDSGVVAPAHSHPGEEIVYVTEGLLEYEVEGKPAVTLKAGGVLFIPAGAVHTAKNVGNGNAAEIATYIVEKGKPLLVLAK